MALKDRPRVIPFVRLKTHTRLKKKKKPLPRTSIQSSLKKNCIGITLKIGGLFCLSQPKTIYLSLKWFYKSIKKCCLNLIHTSEWPEMFSWGKMVGSEGSGCKAGGKPWCNSGPALCQSPGKGEKEISAENSLEKQKILRTKDDLAHHYGIILLLQLATSFEESKCFIAELHSNTIQMPNCVSRSLWRFREMWNLCLMFNDNLFTLSRD